tara:strand:+ start:1376 stop:2020 length:645 start_codon:yes stop_codon:yes gene_type:complete
MGNPSDVEIMVVADQNAGSLSPVTDYLQKKYPWLKFRILEKNGHSNGYGSLVRFALAYSTSRYAVLVSPYGEDDITNINKMLGSIRAGAQVVQATRYYLPEDSTMIRRMFRIYERTYTFLIYLITRKKISDCTYGYKMFDRVFIQALGLTQNGRSISPEITLKGILAGGKIEFISSSLMSKEIGYKFKLYRDGFGYFWLLIRCIMHRIKIILWF